MDKPTDEKEIREKENHREALLNEYIQVSEFIRHYNVMLWSIAAIFYPFSWAGLFYAINVDRVFYFPLSTGSIGLSIVWLFIYERWNFYRKTGFKKLHQLEDKLSLDFHHTVTASDKGLKQKIVSHRTIVRLNLILIIFAWIIMFRL